MTEKEREKLKKTAYHEAGHAVAAFAMSKRFKKVSIIPNPDENSLGRLSGCGWDSKLNPEFEGGPRLRYLVEAQIIILLAGPVAVAKLTGRYNHIGASKDYKWTVDYASYVTGSSEETSAYIKWLIEKTKNVLWSRWDAVELLADELMKQREIAYMATRRIIRKGIDGPLPPLNLKGTLAKKGKEANNWKGKD
jgi:hypothetical protein